MVKWGHREKRRQGCIMALPMAVLFIPAGLWRAVADKFSRST